MINLAEGVPYSSLESQAEANPKIANKPAINTL
jgi:hypothetical protein